ncbi:MAG: aldo/keto reductase [Candidatus Kariarchaeaceae archaeon]|jgi:diketogulonate reductase-like aldo/keto reductase
MNDHHLLQLNDGTMIPVLGFGTADIGDSKITKQAIQYALETGFRYFDTASYYGNEKDIGEVIGNSGIDRKDLIIVTKLWNSDHGYEKALKAFDKSLNLLNLDYIDIYLIHWPVPRKRRDSWRALEKLQDEGLCNSIGVSNYTIKHLKEMKSYASVQPVLNQVEFSPYLNQKDLLEYCTDNNIILQAYSPLTVGKKLLDPKLTEIVTKYGKSTAQILLRWGLQHGLSVIPKATSKERIKENFEIFDFRIQDIEMQLLDQLDENLRLAWDPTDVL